MDLVDQRALVTGATSGIGRAVALKLAETGAEVIVADRDPRRAADAVTATEGKGGRATSIAAELNYLDSVKRPPDAGGPRRGARDAAGGVGRVVTLRNVGGCSVEEVCATLDISASNQRVLLRRGRSGLRASLERQFDD